MLLFVCENLFSIPVFNVEKLFSMPVFRVEKFCTISPCILLIDVEKFSSIICKEFVIRLKFSNEVSSMLLSITVSTDNVSSWLAFCVSCTFWIKLCNSVCALVYSLRITSKDAFTDANAALISSCLLSSASSIRVRRSVMETVVSMICSCRLSNFSIKAIKSSSSFNCTASKLFSKSSVRSACAVRSVLVSSSN